VPRQRIEHVTSQSVGGTILYDVSYQPESESNKRKKVLFLVPGANSDSLTSHVVAVTNAAYKRGYNTFVLNPMCPSDSDHKNLEVIDFANNAYISEAIAKVKQLFGEDADIYALGFSLGGNHIGRHLGSHADCNKVCGIRAFFSVSACYDIPAVTVAL
jgi:predicted alpha/beta-fold hydrolase